MTFQLILADVAEAELTLRCADPEAREVQRLRSFLAGEMEFMTVQGTNGKERIALGDILYGEFVGRTVFLYTKEAVYPSGMSLANLEEQSEQFFRCSKSMVVHLAQIRRLRSEAGGRILATLSNGEGILISRHYAAGLRKKLDHK